MEFFLLTTATVIATVLSNPIAKRVSKRVDDKGYLKLHVHHSVIGLIILTAGLFFTNTITIAVGLGVYLAHGLEEIYFNKKSFPKAFFIFVTK